MRSPGIRSSACCTRLASRCPSKPTSSAGVCKRSASLKGSNPVLILRPDDCASTANVSGGPPIVTPEQAYAELVRLSRDETVLSSCLDILQWDEEVCMPRGGAEHRAEQTALLAGLVHDRAVDPRYEELLAVVEGSPLVADAASPAAVNVRELRRGFDRERRL